MSEADRNKIYLAVFKNASLDIDWKGLADDLGISTVSNTQRKFKESLKKDGFHMVNGKIGPIDQNVETPAKTPAKTTPKRTKKTKSPVKKRKITHVEEDSDQAIVVNDDSEESD